MKLHTTLLILILAWGSVIAQDVSPEKLFYQAVYAEQIDGDLDKARTLYKQILDTKSGDRSMVAKTLYRLGLISEKDGANKALSYYAQVVEQYPEQTDLIELVQNRVDKLDNQQTFIDPRDGHKYKWVKIGDQIWMAENLAFMPWVNPPKKQEFGIWVYDYHGHDVDEAKATENYRKYGCLYDWTMAMNIEPKYLEIVWDGNPENHQGICPPGWFLPSDKDWMELEVSLGFPKELVASYDEDAGPGFRCCDHEYGIGEKLKSYYGWQSGGNGSNSSGFNALPAGVRQLDKIQGFSFKHFGQTTSFWSSTILIDSSWFPSSFTRMLNYRNNQNQTDNSIFKIADEWASGHSIRCIQKSVVSDALTSTMEKPNIFPGSSSDQDSMNFEIYEPTEPFLEIINGRSWSSAVHKNRFIYHSQDDRSLKCMDLNSKEVIWTKECSIWEFPFVISNTTVIFCYKNLVNAINIDSGEMLWSWDSEGKYPTVDNFTINNKAFIRLYERNDNRMPKDWDLACIDIIHGKELWRTKVQEIGIPTSFEASNGKIFVGINQTGKQNHGENKTTLIALDEINGKILWSFNSIGESTFYKPLAIDNQVIFINRGDHYLYSVDQETGELNWKRFFEERIDGAMGKYKDKIILYEQHYSSTGSSYAFILDSQGQLDSKIFIGHKGSPSYYLRIIENKALIRTTEYNKPGHVSVIDLDKQEKTFQINLPSGPSYISESHGDHFYIGAGTKGAEVLYKINIKELLE